MNGEGKGRVPAGEGDRTALAAAVLARRAEIGWTQKQAAGHGGISVDRIQSVESAALTHAVRMSTLEKLDAAVCWEPGSAARVLAGGEPTPGDVPASPRMPPPDG